MIKTYLAPALVVAALWAVACKPQQGSTVQSFLGLDAAQDPALRGKNVGIYIQLSDWFLKFKLTAGQTRGAEGGYKVSADGVRAKLPRKYHDMLIAYLDQQIERNDDFVKAIEKKDRDKVTRLLTYESLELKDIVLAILDPKHQPETQDLFARLIVVARKTTDFIDKFAEKGFLDPLLKGRSFPQLVNDAEPERVRFLDAMKERYLTGNYEVLSKQVRATRDNILQMKAAIESGGAGLNLTQGSNPTMSGPVAAFLAFNSASWDRAVNRSATGVRNNYSNPATGPQPGPAPAPGPGPAPSGNVSNNPPQIAALAIPAINAAPGAATNAPVNSGGTSVNPNGQVNGGGGGGRPPTSPGGGGGGPRPPNQPPFNPPFDPNGGGGRPPQISPQVAPQVVVNPPTDDPVTPAAPAPLPAPAIVDPDAPPFGPHTPTTPEDQFVKIDDPLLNPATLTLTENARPTAPKSYPAPKIDCRTINSPSIWCDRYGAYPGHEPQRANLTEDLDHAFALNGDGLAECAEIPRDLDVKGSTDAGGTTSNQGSTPSCTQHALHTVFRNLLARAGKKWEDVLVKGGEQINSEIFKGPQNSECTMEGSHSGAKSYYANKFTFTVESLGRDYNKALKLVADEGLAIHAASGLGAGWMENGGGDEFTLAGVEDPDPFGLVSERRRIEGRASGDGFSLKGNGTEGEHILNCGSKNGHAYGIVGMRRINGKPHAIVHNSWGDNWEDFGYGYLDISTCTVGGGMEVLYAIKIQ